MSSPDETSRCLRNQQDRLIWRRVFLQALAYALANGLPLHLTEYRKTHIRGVCRWIGNQHLPRYLAEFQWRYNRRFDLASLLPRLLHAAARTPPMPIKFLYLAENAW